MSGPLPNKPTAPATPFSEMGLHLHADLVWAPLRGWIDIRHKPEEVVRQNWIRKLSVDGQFALDQMDQERRTQSGRRSPRADIVVWSSLQDKVAEREPVLVVETKADEGVLRPIDFWQGESYARAAGARFLVLANQTNYLSFELTKGLPGRARQIGNWPTSSDLTDEARIDDLVNRLEVFDREQFQRLLFDCHSLLRDNHAMTPERAFDAISKVLFIKLHIERTSTHETFTTKYLREASRFYTNSSMTVHEQLFNNTKAAYAVDDLFPKDDRLEISPETFQDLVGKLERFNLSKTGDDVKGIAFERFLGRTFRGELGQFFTPRPVVDFMVNALDPLEGELVCDPAAGSGGFLIRVFDHVRDQIAEEVAVQRQRAIDTISSEYPEDADDAALDDRDRRIETAVELLSRELAPSDAQGSRIDTRVGRLAWNCIYGTDKEPRAARTAKMNMIMHGDGHGGIHWHDGLVDINGIFEGRFHVVITNPPFGATVNSSQKIGTGPETDVPDDLEYRRAQERRYGESWQFAHSQVVKSRGKRILEQFEIGQGASSRKTEQMFLERCLRLLRPSGRLAIVLPNGNLNASSQAWLRRWVEGKAHLRGVVALPPETFRFSGASVTASVVFLEKFSRDDADRWELCWADALAETEKTFAARREQLVESARLDIATGQDDELTRIVGELANLGVTRLPPLIVRTFPERLVRSAPVSTLRAPQWEGSASAQSRSLRKQFAERSASVPRIQEAMGELRAAIRKLDDGQTGEMWSHVRKAFDYPVFMATPTAVGITATGETGDSIRNDLPEILSAWRSFIDDVRRSRS